MRKGRRGAAAAGANAILDSSGNGLNGTPIGGPTYQTDVAANPIPQTVAANNLSLKFTGNNQFVAVPDDQLFQLTHSLTLEAYVKPTLFNGAEQIVFRGDDRGGLDPYYLEIGGGGLAFVIESDNNVVYVADRSIFNVQGSWVHVAGTLDDATGTMSLYLNGILVASAVTSVRPLGPLTGPNPGIGIGSTQSTTYGGYFTGLIDEVRISSVALQPNQFLDAQQVRGHRQRQHSCKNADGVRDRRRQRQDL